MATHTASRQSDSRLLRRTLQGNGIFSGISGIVCIVGASPIASFIGLGRPLILVVTGAIVLLYAILDSVWVIGSIILLFGNWISFTIGGKWAIVLVAVVVAIFAELQYYGAWRARQ